METAALSTPESVARGGASPRRVFTAAWLGWTLDGFDNAIYIYVIVPALTELLPASGIVADGGNISRFAGLMFTVFMLGWACSMFWGWFADRFGRVPAMCITVLLYSIFTALCGLAPGILSFAVFRFLTGFGIGGEWAAGAPLLQESVPEHMRERLAAWLHTGTPIGITMRATWSAAGMLSCIIFGLWSSTFWVPTLIIGWQRADGASVAAAQQYGSWAGLIMSFGSLIGCGGMAWIVKWIPQRRLVAAIFFAGSLVCNVVAYLVIADLLRIFWLFMLVLPLLGFFTNGVFALYTVWLPELFPTGQRALGSGFAFSFGRVFGAFGPIIVGFVAALVGSYPIAITAISAIYLIGLPFVLIAPETGGKALEG